ncbi:ORF6C domain-containing protein [Clostridium nigeriense]|uniref:ORF6C domain-containing protein n=1 Tax=Clostridium nigeriense TaxID=1805470 RepID=UPI003D33ED43
MNNLTIKQINIGGQAVPVVTSRQVAEDFGKEHKNILQTISNLAAENSAVKDMMVESTYENRGKQYPEYLLTRDGFSLLVMGFTGSKALSWKLKYIEAFNKMENEIKEQQIPRLSKELQAILMLDEKTLEIDNRVANLENRMTIETGNQKVLSDLVNKKVIAVLGGKDTPAYKELSKKAFSQCWKDYKRIVGVASYKDTAIKDFDFAKKVIIDWQPARELELMIKGCNAQIRM